MTPVGAGTLGDDVNPGDDMVCAAVWPGASLVCTSEAALDRPSELDARFLAAGAGRTTYVHAMHSVVDWFALGVWSPEGRLLRALSLSGANEEVLEDVGDHLAFEEPYWAGELPATEDEEDEGYPFPFHPLELGEAALDHLFGFVLEGHGGPPGDTSVDPFEIPLAAYRLTASSRT